ncbi:MULTISPECIES: isocitrate lyase/phosphoenolpyruvate mutase family protein [unclassified Streptomyces]|uniref:isocitrate lyase/PEP mutase family protein n=1 Tax=unclassified Streptomyces TaxID=2593676 RepID=UPI001BE87EC6|nr:MULTISPECIES: isocitrate lyase/phosphoenolpyruvate mutase family protein [unclassified Streptomyces]MBT2406986.1 isocitrate lyase/phosphoenolpyruvate mutase family protein [Streptomyces sp. ISL-21]MBT2456556.1 isocitrate lyase/phosphoenolpyruvate mutase family protein [Streptomyces sp. ISL-86]MBT2613238.1 isocitrate lyase/phosphoenolpyruvate mutase family protein [Streptomyces sp. ISL-87]
MTNSLDLARRFADLHTPAAPLALANAWDVASARLVEAAGAPAVATTSAGVAWSLGAPDGDALARDRALDLVARVAAAVSVPVTADIEGGFGADPAGVAQTVTGVLAAGAVGVNIEDGSRDPADHAERLAAARAAADAAGIPLYINARVDTYLRGLGDEHTRLDETLSRAAAYLRAGASGIFVPGVTDPATVAALAKGIDAPLNILVGPGAPGVTELGALGAARVSLGSWVAEAAYAVVRRATEELLSRGTYGTLADSLAYGELNGLLKG